MLEKASITAAFLLLLCFSMIAQQETIISGKVTEAESRSGIAFANVYFKGTLIGTVTDFEGNYSIKTSAPKDSIYVSVLGYISETKAVNKGQTQIVNFQLKQTSLNLGIVEIRPGVNPALRIIKNTINNKEKYNRDNLISVQYLSYTKQEVDVDNISPRMRAWKLFNPITTMWDSLESIAGKEQETKLPVSMSEVISEIYTYKEAKKKHEEVKAVKVKFVGMKDGIALSQLMGTDFQSYNFCNNNVPILDKDFLSPIASDALLFYNYYLVDSLFFDSIKCYKIEVKPKNKKDLVYTGTLWITDSTFAIKQLDLELTKDVNFNLVDRVRIQQELIPTEAGAWVPAQTRVLLDYTNITKKLVSAVIHTYNVNRYYVVNQPKEKDFYDTRIQFAEDAITKDSSYWRKERPTPLATTEAHAYKMVDTIRNIKSVKKTVDIVYFLFSGYKDVGPVDIGHYMQVYGHNAYEGTRLRLGFKTNDKFSKNWIVRGYGAYGFKDEKFKYNLQLERVFTRYPWSKAGVQYRQDIDQIGVNTDFSRTMNLSQPPSYLYATSSQIGNVYKLVRKEEYRIWYEREISTGLTTRLTFQNVYTMPLFTATFGDKLSAFQQSNYTVTEIALDARLSVKERYVQNGNDRISLGNKKSPIITFNYTQGIKQLLGGNFNYQKTNISVSTRFRMGAFGYSTVMVKAGKVFSKIPYTALEIPRGNQTFFYSDNVFNQMNYFEFVSDQYVQLFWQHHFMGLFFNRIPLIKKMNLREVIAASAFYGTLSNANKNFNSSNAFTVMTDTPYCEASAGIENILDIIKVDFVYRLTYVDANYKTNYTLANPSNTINNFGVKVSLKFSF
jgi:hypothetical protein